ncbi:DUF397 domain-containing protein [Actinomadura viridis]|uniref:DUF397 domain-containing protein n=1 Tax=Actinomadura viridis TaxID=58110 RepID=UPI0036B8C9D2
MSPAWRKSSRSTGGTGGECVELADLEVGVGLRDSKAPEAGHLVLAPETFAVLMDQIKAGELNL